MTLKPGSKGFVHLGDSFSLPRWRESLVIGIQGKWLQILVRCEKSEIEATGLSSLEQGEGLYCLVEAEVHQLLSGVTEEFLELKTNPKELLQSGLKMLSNSEEELNYATASEPKHIDSTALQPFGGRKKKKAERSSSSSDSSLAPVGEDALANLREQWLGSDIGGGKKERQRSHRRSKRFALIEKKSKKKDKALGSRDMQNAALTAALQSGDPVQGLIAMQLAQGMDRGRKGRHRHKSPRSNSQDSSCSSYSDSSDSEEEKKRLKGHSKAVYGYRKSGKKMFAKPLRHVRKFVVGIQEELGAEDKPFRITDYTKKISWGKQKNLQRCHHLVAVILEYLLKEDYSRGALQCVLTLQAIHQACLDAGEWQVAWLLTHQEDPYQRKLFGGDPNSLQHVTSYLRSMNELAKTTENLRRKGSGKGDAEDQTDRASQGSKGKGRGRVKATDKDKEKDKNGVEQ